MLTNESRRGWLIVERNSIKSRDLCGRWREERVCNNAHCIELQWINNNHIFDLFSASIIFAYTLRPSWNCNWIEILSPFSLSAASQATGWNATAPGRCIWAGISHRTNTHGIHSSSSCKFSRESKAFESCWNVLNEILQPIRRHFCARLMYFMFKLSSALISNLFFLLSSSSSSSSYTRAALWHLMMLHKLQHHSFPFKLIFRSHFQPISHSAAGLVVNPLCLRRRYVLLPTNNVVPMFISHTTLTLSFRARCWWHLNSTLNVQYKSCWEESWLQPNPSSETRRRRRRYEKKQ